MVIKIGLVGLGLMGQAMSISLSKAGFELYGYDIVPEQMRLAEGKGVRGLPSPRDVASASDVVISSLPSSEIVEAVHCGRAAHARGQAGAGLHVDTSTISRCGSTMQSGFSPGFTS